MAFDFGLLLDDLLLGLLFLNLLLPLFLGNHISEFLATVLEGIFAYLCPFRNAIVPKSVASVKGFVSEFFDVFDVDVFEVTSAPKCVRFNTLNAFG